MERNIQPGQQVTVKPTHRADLRGDPSHGTVIAVFPKTLKVKVLWANGKIQSHGFYSPYMDRFNIG